MVVVVVDVEVLVVPEGCVVVVVEVDEPDPTVVDVVDGPPGVVVVDVGPTTVELVGPPLASVVVVVLKYGEVALGCSASDRTAPTAADATTTARSVAPSHAPTYQSFFAMGISIG